MSQGNLNFELTQLDEDQALTQRDPVAWQPLTPRGIAAFAFASHQRLLVVQGAFAFLGVLVWVWFLLHACFPSVEKAFLRLPDQGRIFNGELLIDWSSPAPLLEDRVLGATIHVNPGSHGASSLSSDFQLEFHRSEFRICSLFGCLAYPYPSGWVIEVNRRELIPWWQAWKTMVVTTLSLAVILILFLSWALLASIYWPVPWLIGFYSDRKISLGGSWRMAAASQLPGTVLLLLGLLLYSFGLIDLFRLAILGLLHLLTGWIYLGFSPFCLPRTDAPRKNPFGTRRELPGKDVTRNPFNRIHPPPRG